MRAPFKLRSSGPFKLMGSKEKKKESEAMSSKIKEVSTVNYNETNKALVKAGKPEITRAEYNESLGRSKESSI